MPKKKEEPSGDLPEKRRLENRNRQRFDGDFIPAKGENPLKQINPGFFENLFLELMSYKSVSLSQLISLLQDLYKQKSQQPPQENPPTLMVDQDGTEYLVNPNSDRIEVDSTEYYQFVCQATKLENGFYLAIRVGTIVGQGEKPKIIVSSAQALIMDYLFFTNMLTSLDQQPYLATVRISDREGNPVDFQKIPIEYREISLPHPGTVAITEPVLKFLKNPQDSTREYIIEIVDIVTDVPNMNFDIKPAEE